MKQKIKTFSDACKALKLKASEITPDFSMVPAEHADALLAHFKLLKELNR